MNQIVDFFTHPFFSVVGGITSLLALIGTGTTIFLILKGSIPVWYRLGLGLSKRKIAIFADLNTYNSLEKMLLASKLFPEKNINHAGKDFVKSAENTTMLLMHWKSFHENLDDVLNLKKDTDALIVYAPQSEGRIETEFLNKINNERNSIIVNFRGRLLNDIFTCMMTTGYQQK
ncbi:conserved hypothetical protein [Chloroherpeton thalassium ATCC 35110]|uniref:Uncharacterized protein n=1 Tax=Chloroherpeton thalassium (strain ATCC 35110 / GB-78) TaxID=517418 RepID=B3QV00_CHLT3|nr:hypothetical protein [Chloroherpeton thalassium]ACF14501.1 conserved hypothetical protein [Chloroherpeton thalassium ATCC 35110]